MMRCFITDSGHDSAETKGDSTRFRGRKVLPGQAVDWHLQRNGCNFANILRLSVYGSSDLLSPVYDALRVHG